MRNALTSILALYWTAVFAALAVSCVYGAEHGIFDALHLLGLSGGTPLPIETSMILSGVLGCTFTVVCATFLWVLATGAMSRDMDGRDAGDVMRIALCVAGVAIAMAAGAALFMSMQSVLAVAGIQFAGLLGTYLAVDTVREKAVPREMTLDEARIMALKAAKQYAMGRSMPNNVINFRDKR
jgi:hypothetical protein